MMFGTVLVSTIGIALPALAGVLLAPRSEGQPSAASPQIWSRIKRNQRRLLQQSHAYLASLNDTGRQRHLPGSIAHSSSGGAG
jgi:hypothetical protein